MKKLVFLLTVLLSVAVHGAWAEVKNGESGQCTWTFDTETGILTISPGSEGGVMADYEYVNTSSILDSYVNAPWWADRMNITQVVINDGVTYIGKLAFNNCRLTDIVVPNSVTKVGEKAFMTCTASTITIGDGVTDIGDDAFYCLPYTPDGTFVKQTVTMGKSVKNVGSTAFAYSCIQHLTLMGPAFESWTEAPSVSDFKETMIHVTFANYDGWIAAYPNYKPYMDWYAGGDQSNQWTSGDCTVTLNLDYTMTISGTGAMADYDSVDDCPWKHVIGNVSAVTVEEGVTKLSKNGFVGADNVIDVYLKCDPFTKETWADYANAFNPATVYTCEKEGWFVNFSDMGGQFLTRCGDGVAWNYKNKVLTFSKYADGTGVMNHYSSYEDERAPWDNLLMTDMEIINIEDGVTTIGNYAFNACNATEISMPASVTTIGRGAFRFSHIKRFEMPATMTEVPNDLFYGSSIEEVVLPEGLTTISPQAFLQCTSLKQIYLPKTLSSIGFDAFKEVTSAVDIYAYSILNPNNVEWSNPASDFSANAKVHVPTGRASAWQNRFPTATVQWVDDAYGDDAPMELATAADWRNFCNQVACGARNIHVKMTADITISDNDGYVGTGNNPFSGVFDGNGHTLTLDYGERGEGNLNRAPFMVIRGATIRNIHFAGKHENYQYFSVFAGNYYRGSSYCAGVVSNVFGTGNMIENCRISTTFCYAGANNGGVVANVYNNAALTIVNVLYDGKFVYGHAVPPTFGYDILSVMSRPENNAIFVSHNMGTVRIIDSYINAAELRTVKSNGSKFPNYLWAYNDGGTTTLDNCYYKNPGAYILGPAATDASTLTTEQLNHKMGAMWQQDGDNFAPLWLFPMQGEGTAESPYLIDTDVDWRRFIHYTKFHTEQYKGKQWKQTADISGTTKWGAQLIGSDTAPAIYDGNGKTLDVDIISDDSYVAPIALMQKATIQGVTVQGSINAGLHTAGLVCMVMGSDNIITNSHVKAAITFGTSDPHAGGFVGHAYSSTLTVDGCKFSGTMTTPTNSENSAAGAIVGWADNNDHINVTNCVDQGKYNGYIHHKGVNLYITNLVITPFGTNCLSYEKLAGGAYPHPLNWDKEQLALTMGSTLIDYPVAGIKSYNTVGLYLDDVYYVGEWHQVSFDVTTAEGYPVCSVKANGEPLEPNSDGHYKYTVTQPTEITADPKNILLKDNADNSTVLAKYNGVTCDVTLQNRTFYKDGTWNTLCLPFDVDNFEGTPFEGATVMTLSSSKFSNGTLTLNFSKATAIEAGMPFIVKWAGGDNVENPVFENVTIKGDSNTSTATDAVTFQGIYSPLSITAEDKTMLYMGAGNTLYYPNGEMTIGAFRAYFRLVGGITAGDLSSDQGARIVLNFDDEEATAIENLNPAHASEGEGSWFTLDGRRINSKPSQSGIYINNGKKVVIK